MSEVNAIPDGYPRVSPPLSVSGCADAIDFYKSVFAASERMRMATPDEAVAHAEVQIGDSVGMFDDPFGHRWNVATHIEDVPSDEMGRRAAEVMAAG